MNFQEEIKQSFPLKIIEALNDGFWAVSPTDKSLIKYKSIVRDKIFLKNSNFKKNDIVKVTLELIKKKEIEIVNENEIMFCVSVFQTASNGIYTKTYVEGEHPSKSILWYESRGMITAKLLENNPFEVGDLVKIIIRRL